MTLNSYGEDNATIVVRGISIHLNTGIINTVTTIPLGVRWGKEDKIINVTTKKSFFPYK